MVSRAVPTEDQVMSPPICWLGVVVEAVALMFSTSGTGVTPRNAAYSLGCKATVVPVAVRVLREKLVLPNGPGTVKTDTCDVVAAAEAVRLDTRDVNVPVSTGLSVLLVLLRANPLPL